MEMVLSPVVKTELSMPTHENAASLQNPVETQGGALFSSLHCMVFPLFLPPLPGVFLGTQLYCHLNYIKVFSGACGVYTRN